MMFAGKKMTANFIEKWIFGNLIKKTLRIKNWRVGIIWKTRIWKIICKLGFGKLFSKSEMKKWKMTRGPNVACQRWPCKLETRRGEPRVERCWQERGLIPLSLVFIPTFYVYATTTITKLCAFWSKDGPIVGENLDNSWLGPQRNSFLGISFDSCC